MCGKFWKMPEMVVNTQDTIENRDTEGLRVSRIGRRMPEVLEDSLFVWNKRMPTDLICAF